MEHFFLAYNWSILGTALLVIWFLSNFKTHIINTVLKKDLDETNIDEFIAMKFDIKIFKTDFTIGSLIMCPICIGFWIALILSAIAGEWSYLAHIYVFQIFNFALIKKLIQ